MQQVIRIQTMSQWYLLRQLNLNGCLSRKRIPNEVMDRIYRILHNREVAGNDFIVLCFKKIRDTYLDIEAAVNLYPYRIELSEDIDVISTISPEGKKRDWYMSHVRIKGQNTKIRVIYTTKSH